MSEIGYGQLMEIYIPIYLESTSPIGVIELYYNMDTMNESIHQINLLIVTSVTIMALAIICAVIIFSITTIHSSRKTIENEKFASIGNLSSRLAHDIRNPLTVIKATLDIIKSKNDNLSPDDLEKLNKLDNQVYRISHQVNNVLDYIRGKPLSVKEYSLKEIVESSINDLPEHKGIEIKSSVIDLKIKCDFEALKIVFINIIFNAIQAVGEKGEIRISTKHEEGKIIIEIEDSGSIEGKIEEVFEPLYTTKQEGTGLGLASCKSIIEQHGGRISVSANPTTFSITLPKD